MTGVESQTTSQRLLVEPSTGGGDYGIDGLELHHRGLYWWKVARTGGEFSSSSRMGVIPTVGSRADLATLLVPYRPNEGTPPLDGAVRDGGWIYFSVRLGATPGLYRKAASAWPSDAFEVLHYAGAPQLSGMGAVAIRDGYVYYSPQYDNGYTGIVRVAIDDLGNASGLELKTEGVIPGGYGAKKIVFYRRSGSTYGLILKLHGELYKFGPLEQAGKVPFTKLASGVGDVIVRNEFLFSGGLFGSRQDTIYGTTYSLATPGRLFRLNPDSGAVSNVFTDPAGRIFNSLAADDNFLFVSRSSGATGEILRDYLPANSVVLPDLSLETNGWVTMETVPASVMRSDGQWLTFARDHEVRRVSTTVPPLSLDIHAYGLEAVQVIQDANNSIRLVEDKPAVVRGYARLAANSAAFNRPTRSPEASLVVFHDGAVVGVIYPVDSPAVGVAENSAATLLSHRSNPALSFQFEVPGSMIRRGTMRFEMRLNERRAILETGGGNPYANNVISTPGMITVARVRPTLIFSTINNAGAPGYTLDTDRPGFLAQLARARSLLPVSDFDLRVSPLWISREQIIIIPPGIKRYAFNMETNSQAALTALAEADLISSGSDQHRIGMVHPAIPMDADGGRFNGLGQTPGSSLLTRMEPGSPGVDWNAPWGGRILAHELGHNYGRQHVRQGSACGGSAPARPDMAYPNPGCSFGPGVNSNPAAIFAFDPLTATAIDGTTAGDLMSYSDNRWTSDYTFNALLDAVPARNRIMGLPAALAEADDTKILMVAGMMNLESSEAELWPAQCAPVDTYASGKIAASLAKAEQPQGHGYRIRQVNGAGAVLAESNLVLLTSDGDGDESVMRGFAQFVAVETEVREIRILQGSALLARLPVSPTPPAVVSGTPSFEAASGTVRWSWTASDADGDPVFSTVQFSHDNGATWETARADLAGTSTVLEAATLRGGAMTRLRVIATDGFHATVAQSPALALPRHAPTLTLTGLNSGMQLPFHADLSLMAFAHDVEDGTLSATAISWTLTGPHQLASTGERLALQCLPPGAYVATASASDLDGQQASASVSFQVLPFVIPEVTASASPVLDGEPDETSWASAAVICWRDGLGVPLRARLLRAGAYVYVSFSDLPYSQIGTPAATAGISFDANGTAEATAQAGDAGFSVDQTGRPRQTQGNGSVMVNRAQPASAFEAVVHQGALGWSSEMKIPSALVGAAGQPVRFAILGTVSRPGESLASSWPNTATPDAPASWSPVLASGVPPPPANAAPTARAGADQIVQASQKQTILLNGGSSSDPEGNPLTFRWVQKSGAPAGLTGALTAQASFVADPAGGERTWTFSLVVNDGGMASVADEVAIRLVPQVVPAYVRGALPPIVRTRAGAVEGYLPVTELEGSDAPVLPGSRYLVESSLDMRSWMPLQESSPDLIGRLFFQDSTAGIPRKFYRALPADSAGVADPGQLLEFGLPGSRVQINTTPLGNLYPLTVLAWVRTSDARALVGGIVSKYADGSGNGWSVGLFQGRLFAFYFRDWATAVFAPQLGVDGGFIADGDWHHVAFVIEASGGILYVDGAARGSLPWTGTAGPSTSPEPLQIGRYHNYPNSIVAEIDEVSLWSSALSVYDVLAIRRHGPLGSEPTLQGWWKFDEGTGATVRDNSPFGRHGILLNDPLWRVSTAPIRR